jgi:hypothetical protein
MTFPWTESYGGECPGVYFIRLQRDGWAMGPTQVDESKASTTQFDKRINAHWTLRKLAHGTIDHPIGRGCYFDEHLLINSRTGENLPFPDWEWADVDGSRLVWATAGAIYAAHVARTGIGAVQQLQDFNALTFEAIKAPY